MTSPVRVLPQHCHWSQDVGPCVSTQSSRYTGRAPLPQENLRSLRRLRPEIGCLRGGITVRIEAFSASGDVVGRYGYKPYAKLTILAAGGSTVRASSSYANKYTDTGRRSDADLSLDYSRARMHLPNLGRFSSRDPLGYLDGVSLYPGHFVPARVDPFGIDWAGTLKTPAGSKKETLGAPCPKRSI